MRLLEWIGNAYGILEGFLWMKVEDKWLLNRIVSKDWILLVLQRLSFLVAGTIARIMFQNRPNQERDSSQILNVMTTFITSWTSIFLKRNFWDTKWFIDRMYQPNPHLLVNFFVKPESATPNRLHLSTVKICKLFNPTNLKFPKPFTSFFFIALQSRFRIKWLAC